MSTLQTAPRRLSEAARQALRHARFTRWRLANLARILAHRPDVGQDGALRPLARELRHEGILTRPYAALCASGSTLFQAVLARARELWAQAKHAQAQGIAGKEYKVTLTPPSLSVDDPLVRLALDPRLLELVNRYLGLCGYLRIIDVWWDRPTLEPPKETQLWHRDGDDLASVKVFLYLNDVDLQTGPFCFIPRSHFFGLRHRLTAAHDAQGRSTDNQMAGALHPAQWRTCTGPAGTLTLCDTSGFHKDFKPAANERLALLLQYTSGAPKHPRVLRFTGPPQPSWSRAQRLAIGAVT